MHKKMTLVGVLSLLAVAAGCSDSGSNNAVAPPPAPAPGPVAASIAGQIDQSVPSVVLPSASLPSASLPSVSLPSESLPTTEVDESPRDARLRTIEVTLEARQEVVDTPLNPGNDNLTATGLFTLSEINGVVTARVVAQGIDADDTVTAVHIHSGFAGENGGILLGLNATDDPLVFEGEGTVGSLADIPGDDFATFFAGGWYFNLHTTSNPSGQLRGQIFTRDVDVVRMQLEGQQENPAVSNAMGIGGVAYATIDAANETVVLNASVQGFIPELDAPIGPVHLHRGFAGENGPVLIPLAPVGDSDTAYRATEADAVDDFEFVDITRGATYINIHSAENSSGEVRGQLVPADINVSRLVLQGEQENPPIINAPGVSGTAYVTVDPAEESIVVNTSVEGFVPTLDAPIGPVHLHAGFAGENGPAVLALQPVEASETVYRGTEADFIDTISFEQITAGGVYVNIHSLANPSGELRGQVVLGDTDVSRIVLQGAQENPPVINADGISGIAYATLNAEDQGIVLTASVEGFVPELDAPIGPVHLHNGFAGENGPVLLALQPVDGSETQYRGTELDAVGELDFAAVAEGGTYFNIHSAANPSGEVRGQLVPRHIDVARMELQGAQENPPVENAAGISGVAYATVNTARQGIVLNATVQGFVPSLPAAIGPVHLHSGFAGENGPVLLPLQPVDGSDTVYRGTEADLTGDLDFAQLAQGGTYINVHSEANGSGEVRGQLIGRHVEAVRAELEGQQENPVVINADGVSGIAYATFNAAEQRIVLNTTVEGFVPSLDAAIGPVHLHSGVAGINGPVLLALQPVDGSETVYRGTEADVVPDQTLDFTALRRGETYINVHSADNGSGEVRGQIISSDSAVLRAELSGDQVTPADPTSATGVGYLTIVDRLMGRFVSNVRLNGLDATDVAVIVPASDGDTVVETLAQDAEDPALFISEEASVVSVQGTLNGMYRFVAEGTESDN